MTRTGKRWSLDLSRLLWLVLCAFTGAGVVAYCGHYWGRRPLWRIDGSQEGAA